jgi:hypothetical protein
MTVLAVAPAGARHRSPGNRWTTAVRLPPAPTAERVAGVPERQPDDDHHEQAADAGGEHQQHGVPEPQPDDDHHRTKVRRRRRSSARIASGGEYGCSNLVRGRMGR